MLELQEIRNVKAEILKRPRSQQRRAFIMARWGFSTLSDNVQGRLSLRATS